MPQYITCANCGALIIKRSHKQMYCNIVCCNRAQYKKYRDRSRNTDTHKTSSAILVATSSKPANEQSPDAIRAKLKELEEAEARSIKRNAAAADAFAFLGHTPTAPIDQAEANISEEEYEKTHGTRSGMPRGSTTWTKEQVEAFNQKREEDRLLALDKANRAEAKRQRALARARKIEAGEDNPGTITNILRDHAAKDEEI